MGVETHFAWVQLVPLPLSIRMMLAKLAFCVTFSLGQAQERSFSSLLFDPFEFRTSSLSQNRIPSFAAPRFNAPAQNIQRVNTQPQGSSERDFVQLKDFDSLFDQRFENRVKPTRNPRPNPRVPARFPYSKPRNNVPLPRLPTLQSPTTARASIAIITTTTIAPTTTTTTITTTTTATTTTETTTTRAPSTTRRFKKFKPSSGSERRVLKKVRRKQATTPTTPVTTTTVSIITTTPKTLRVKFRVASSNSRSRVGQQQLPSSGQQSQAPKSSLNQQQLLNLQSFLAHQNKPKGETFPNFPSA